MSRRGFTYLELTTVWAIIAILAAILFPVFARARAKATQTNCLRNLLNIGVALHTYAQDHYGHFPPQDNDLWPLVPKYLPDARVLLCPAMEDRQRKPGEPRIPAEPAYGSQIDYVYRAGWCDDDKPRIAIAGDEEADRHNEGFNCLFLDGSARWISVGPRGRDRYLKQYEGLEELRKLQKPLPESLPVGPLGGPGPPPGGGPQP